MNYIHIKHKEFYIKFVCVEIYCKFFRIVEY